jgi:hypothetical protein
MSTSYVWIQIGSSLVLPIYHPHGEAHPYARIGLISPVGSGIQEVMDAWGGLAEAVMILGAS